MEEQVVLNEIIELHKTASATNQKVSDLVDRFDKVIPYMTAKHTELADRVTVVEKTQAVTMWKLGTFSAAAGAFLTYAVQWIWVHLFGGVKVQ